MKLSAAVFQRGWNFRFYKPIFVISITLNLIFLAYGAKKVYWTYSQWRNSNCKLLSEMSNNQRDSLIIDKKTLYLDSTAIVLTLGQSLSANYGQGSYFCHNQVFNYFNGSLYKAKEPLLGATGGSCSVWTRFSDLLIDSGLYKRVILIPIGIGGTSIDCWSNGDCNQNLQEILKYIKRDSIKITHVIWHQGESDNLGNTPKEIYKAKLKKILLQIRKYGLNADFYVCVASYHPNLIDKYNGIDTAIQNAQIEFVRENIGTKLGANTDLINLAADRYDGVHFSMRGLDKFAKLLYQKVKD